MTRPSSRASPVFVQVGATRITSRAAGESARPAPSRPRRHQRRTGASGSRSPATRTRLRGRAARRSSTASRSTRAWPLRETTSTSTSATPSTPTAASPARPREQPRRSGQKYKLGLALPALRTLRASAGLYSHWDDHEFVNDFSLPEHGEAIYAAGVRAFRDYSPATYSRDLGLYRSVRWGRHLELFFLDERSFRSGKATAACGNDLAPTAPQPVRDAFAALAPGLRNPVPPACLAAINDPTRTMLGARQYAVVHERDQGVEGHLEGRRERGSDPAVLRAPVRPLGGLRRRARAPPPLPPAEHEERRLPRDGHACEPHQRGALPHARRRARGLRDVGGRRPARSRRTRSRRRSTASSVSRAAAPRSPRSSSSLSLRTGSGCAAPRSTRTATRR